MIAALASTAASLGLAALIGLMVNRRIEKLEREPQWWPPFGE